MTLTTLPNHYAVWKLPPDAPLPTPEFFCIVRTSEELSLVTQEGLVPEGVPCERGWRALKVLGPLDFALVGVLAALTVPLAGAGIPVFAISTFDTDYLLVKEERLDEAFRALRDAGHFIA